MSGQGARGLRRALFSACLLFGTLALGAVTACTSEAPEAAVGKVGLRLTAENNGVEYRLRSATFVVEGPETITLTTEDDPDAVVLSADLAPGQYSITLEDGWFLERSEGGAYEEVGAELLSDNPLPLLIQSSVLTQATFRFLSEGVVVDPYPPANVADVLGFEDESLWSSSAALSLSDMRVQALHSLGVVGTNFRYVDSVPLSNLAVTEDRVAVAIRLPNQQPNANWYGEVQLALDAPSIGLNDVTVGSVPLTGLPTAEFVDLEFSLSPAVLAALEGSYSDLVIRLGLNVPYNATGTYRFDNLRFGGVSACDFGCEDGTCVDGICQIECPELYGDCDGDLTNACETALDSDSTNCGACDNQCAPGSLCEAGACVASVECGTNEADCDGNAGNGCEVDTSSDVEHCGACGASCESGQECISGSCLAGDLNGSIQITTDWGSGYCAVLRLTNVGNAPTTTWSVVLHPQGGTFSPWSVNSTGAAGVYTLTPLSWNAQIAPGATNTSVGFCSNRSGGSAVATILSVSP